MFWVRQVAKLDGCFYICKRNSVQRFGLSKGQNFTFPGPESFMGEVQSISAGPEGYVQRLTSPLTPFLAILFLKQKAIFQTQIHDEAALVKVRCPCSGRVLGTQAGRLIWALNRFSEQRSPEYVGAREGWTVQKGPDNRPTPERNWTPLLGKEPKALKIREEQDLPPIPGSKQCRPHYEHKYKNLSLFISTLLTGI